MWALVAVATMQRLLLVAAVAAMTVAAPVEIGPPGSEAQQRLMREEPKGEERESVTISSKGQSLVELEKDASEEDGTGDAHARKHQRRHHRNSGSLEVGNGTHQNIAEIACPWFFNINTNEDTMIRCYKDGHTCDPTGPEGSCCCEKYGGVYQCSKTQPYMCAQKDCGGGTSHKCQADSDCSNAAGPRECEGPPGIPGPPGHVGATGEHGETGSRGHIGDPGTTGHQGHEGATGKAGPDKVAAPTDAATKSLMVGVFFLNILVALGMYFLTQMQYKQMMKHADDHVQPVEAGG